MPSLIQELSALFGAAFEKAGDWKKSRVELERALSLKPDLDGAEDARKTLAIVGGASPS